jgi:hypothetical protein
MWLFWVVGGGSCACVRRGERERDTVLFAVVCVCVYVCVFVRACLHMGVSLCERLATRLQRRQPAGARVAPSRRRRRAPPARPGAPPHLAGAAGLGALDGGVRQHPRQRAAQQAAQLEACVCVCVRVGGGLAAEGRGGFGAGGGTAAAGSREKRGDEQWPTYRHGPKQERDRIHVSGLKRAETGAAAVDICQLADAQRRARVRCNGMHWHGARSAAKGGQRQRQRDRERRRRWHEGAPPQHARAEADDVF